MKKRIPALFLTLAMLLSMLPMAALAEDYEADAAAEAAYYEEDAAAAYEEASGAYEEDAAEAPEYYSDGIAAETTDASTNPFTDMTDGNAYYYKAVFWAVDKGITTGTSSTTFSPNKNCTRGQVVTFLYRQKGSPAVSGSNSFTDVNSSDYFYKPVLWAVRNNITNGTTATTFKPNQACTRAQVVTFLYRAAGCPAVSGSNPFTDVKPTDYFYNAVLWAVKNNITNGTSDTTFSPNQNCTRAQVVTFMYRAAGSPAVSTPAPYVAPKPDYGSLYADKLTQLLKDKKLSTSEGPRFALAYVDNDDVPELLVCYGFIHADGAQVFSIKNNTVVAATGISGGYGTLYYIPRTGKVYTFNSGMGITDYYIMTVSGGTTTSTHDLHADYGMEYTSVTTYAYDNQTITEAAYKSYYNSMINAYNWTAFTNSDGLAVSTSNIAMLRSDYTRAFLN